MNCEAADPIKEIPYSFIFGKDPRSVAWTVDNLGPKGLLEFDSELPTSTVLDIDVPDLAPLALGILGKSATAMLARHGVVLQRRGVSSAVNNCSFACLLYSTNPEHSVSVGFLR